MPNYLPYSERRVSSEYQDMLRTIRDTGARVRTKQGVDALALAGCAMRFPMEHGAAVITETGYSEAELPLAQRAVQRATALLRADAAERFHDFKVERKLLDQQRR